MLNLLFAILSYTWGDNIENSFAVLRASKICAAEVYIINRITNGPNDIYFKLENEDLEISVTALQEPGMVPDLFHIDVPEDYYADPQEIILEEGKSGVIQICQFIGA